MKIHTKICRTIKNVMWISHKIISRVKYHNIASNKRANWITRDVELYIARIL
jgi:hypothetical protein